jgi:phage/plasmid primase-like uncharacterized protein
VEWRPEALSRRLSIHTPEAPPINFDAMAAQCEAALGPHRRALLANELGVASDALSRLQVGWSQVHRSFTFPMRNASGYARGIRLRRMDGSKWAVKGSRQGLFLPRHFPLDESLMVCEGASDTAAMLTACFSAVGRPSCNGGADLLVDLVAHYRPADVVIVADRDAAGERGARDLAAQLVPHVAYGVKVITPPTKDAREWVNRGADRLDVLDAIAAAPALTLTYSVKAVAP